MRKLILAAFAVAASVVAWACVPAGQSVFLVAAQFLGEDCAVDFTIERTRGSVNLALTNSYIAAFSTESTMVVSETTANGVPVDSPSSNDFIGNQAVLNYFAVENGVRSPLGITQQILPILAVIEPGAERSGSFMTLDLLTPAAATAIAALPKPVDVVVSLRIDGQLRGGAALSTNTIEFPIRVIDVAPTCASGLEVVYVPGACGNTGQDGVGFVCAAPGADAGIVTLDPSSF